MVLSVLLIGLGKIAYRYSADEIFFMSSLPTHYSTARETGCNIVFGVDVTEEACQFFTETTGISSSTNLRDGLRLLPDLIVISTDFSSHLSVLNEIASMNCSPKALIVEKPLGNNFNEAVRIVNLSRQITSNIYINYSREYSTGKILLKRLIDSPIESIELIYSVDLVSNASHFLRLIVDAIFPADSIPEINIIEPDPVLPSFRVSNRNNSIICRAERSGVRKFSVLLNFKEKTILIENESVYVRYRGTKSDLRNQYFYDVFSDGMYNLYLRIKEETIEHKSIQRDIDYALLTSRVISQALLDDPFGNIE